MFLIIDMVSIRVVYSKCCCVVVLCWGHWLELPLLTLNCCVMFGVAGLPCPWLLPRCTELSRCTLYTTTGEVRTLNLSTERDSGKLGFYAGLKTKTITGILMITIIIKHQAYFAQSFVLCTLLVVHQLHFQSVHRSCEDIPVLGLSTWTLCCCLLVELKTWFNQ